MGTGEGDYRMGKPKPSKKMGSMEVRKLDNPDKHKDEISAAPFRAPHLLNSLQNCNQQIHHTQDGSFLSNSQPYFYHPPQVMSLPPNRAPQLYPVYYYNGQPHAYSNAVGDFTLPVPEKGKDILSEKKLDCEGSSEVVELCGDRSSRTEMGATSSRDYTHDPSRSVACGDNEASSDKSDDTNKDFSATKNPRLNQINAYDYSAVAGSALGILETAPNLGMSYSSAGLVSKPTNTSDDYEVRMQRRRELNRESAKRSRLRKQQEYEKLQAKIEALKAESSELCEELRNLSEECGRLEEENEQIKEELV